MKGMVRFGKKREVEPCYVGPYKIMQKVCKVSYELKIPSELASIDLVFHVFLLKNCICDTKSNPPIEGLGVKDNLSYDEVPVQILNRQVKKLRNKEEVSTKVLWKNHLVEGATWEAESHMKSRYPHLFKN